MVMRLGALCSGGKDSSYALWLALKENNEIENIIAMYPKREDSWMFHKPNPEILHLFAEATSINLIEGKTEGEKEEELEDLKSLLRGLSIDGVVSGAVASKYQKNRIGEICKELGLSLLTPLWNLRPIKLLQEMVEKDFEIIITSVSAKGFTKEWLGRRIDERCIEDLKNLRTKHGVNPIGEGGEYETLVLDAPFFKKKIIVGETSSSWRNNRGSLKIEEAELARK